MAGLLFITAPSADYKVMNRLLLYLRDIEYESGDRFRIVNTKNAYDLVPPPGDNSIPETVPPVQPDFFNAWAGASLEEVEGFVLDLCKSEREMTAISPSLYVLLDEQGLEDKTCILAEREYHFDDEDDGGDGEGNEDDEEKEQIPEGPLDSFKKARVPWHGVYMMWCNLEIANMDFEDYCDDEREKDEHGFLQYHWPHGPDADEVAAREKRDEEIRKLEEEGMA